MMKKIWLIAILFSSFACQEKRRAAIDEEVFAKYWYQGKAEINIYELNQFRYGEQRKGESVMIFVTEDFSKKDHVKLDKPSETPSDARKVMKLNRTRKFQTGVYPYHTMLSVFTPVYEDLNSPKVVATVTEWCGQSFIQMNLRNSSYKISSFSYFQSEGDTETKVRGQAEDELWNLIRLNPDLIIEGETEMIPGAVYQRFQHVPAKAEIAHISKRKISSTTAEVEVSYEEIKRKLVIRYQQKFPYQILSWEESQTKSNGEIEVTKALRKKVTLLDYWNKNSLQDEELSKSLSL